MGTDNAGSEGRTAAVERRAPQVTSGSITLYHCKAYNGGTFWTNTHCNQHQALIERMVEVPARLRFLSRWKWPRVCDALPQRCKARHPLCFKHRWPATEGRATRWHSRYVRHGDALARQPQSAQTQDWIRVERHKTRDCQWSLCC